MAAPLKHATIDDSHKLRAFPSDHVREARRKESGLACQQRQAAHQIKQTCILTRPGPAPDPVDCREGPSSQSGQPRLRAESGFLESRRPFNSPASPTPRPARKASARQSEDKNNGLLPDKSRAALCNRQAEPAMVAQSHVTVEPQLEPSGSQEPGDSDSDALSNFAGPSLTPGPSPQGGFWLSDFHVLRFSRAPLRIHSLFPAVTQPCHVTAACTCCCRTASTEFWTWQEPPQQWLKAPGQNLSSPMLTLQK